MINQDCYPFTFVHRSKNCGQGILKVSDTFQHIWSETNYLYLHECHVPDLIFKHVENVEKSAYMLINRKELEEYPNLVEEIERTFQELYNYFD